MRAVDILPAGPTAGADQAEVAPKNFRRESGAGDFDQAMSQALSPPGKKSHPAPHLRHPSNDLSERPVPAKSTAKTSATEAAGPANADEPVAQKADAEAKHSAELPEKLSPDPAPVWPFPAAVANVLPPLLLSPTSVPPVNSSGTSTAVESGKNFHGEVLVTSAIANETKTVNPLDSQNQSSVLPGQRSPTEVGVLPSAEPKDIAPGAMTLSAAQFVAVAETAQPTPLPDETMSAAWEKSAATIIAGQMAKDAGTGVATTTAAMKKTDNMAKVAGLEVKVLPGTGQETPRETVLAPRLAVSPVRSTENNSLDANLTFSNGAALSLPPTAPTVSFSPVEIPSLTDARLKSVERTHDMVALHAMRLVESKSDVLSVVIKPAVGTELTLELRQRESGVEAHAVLSRGDFQFLNQHWPELQQRLEQRGIKLAALGGETNFSQDNQQQQRSARDEAAMESAAAFAEFASLGGATARRAMSLNGWESWA